MKLTMIRGALSNTCSTDIKNLLRAYNLLVATRDDERALIGRVSREWLKSESESWVNLADVPLGVLETVRGKQIVCDALMPDLDANAEEIALVSLLSQIKSSGKSVNTNSFAKLEPAIAAELLLAAMLLGVQKYGNKRRGSQVIDNDLIIAAMIRRTLGKKDRYSAVLPGKCRIVDLAAIQTLFGRQVVDHLKQVHKAEEAFLASFKDGCSHQLKLSRGYANVVAAIQASQLRLVARAAGDEVLANLDQVKREEMTLAGFDCSGSFPERPWLDLHYRQSRAALSLSGVDYGALAEPLEHTLMSAVADTLADASKRRRLVGRRGKAVHGVHNNLPLIESFNAGENYNSLATIHIAALEMMQYLEKGRRKSAGTMIGHSLRIAAVSETIFGDALEPCVATIGILHDVVEDGSRPIAGYDQSLNNIKNRFGGPLAAMVSELTDAESSVSAYEKAQATLRCKSLILPQQQYNFDRFTEMTLQATATHEPYTLCGIITKLIDTAISEEEGIHDPDMMPVWWKHSGIRIYWSCHIRGRVVRPLLLKLAQEIEKHDNSTQCSQQALSDSMINALRRLVAFSIQSSDRYAVQNLAIVADEYGLGKDQRRKLVELFFDANIDQDDFRDQLVPEFFNVDRLQEMIFTGVVPSRCYVTMYSKESGESSEFDATTFIKYRAAALQRQEIASRLGLPSVDTRGSSAPLQEIISLYDLRKAA